LNTRLGRRTGDHFLKAGDMVVSRRPVEMTTILGSCVSIFLRDRRTGAGGGIHFKSPQTMPGKQATNLHGEVAAPALLQEMLRMGSRLNEIEASVFGGGVVIAGFGPTLDIGGGNIRYAMAFLARERIRIAVNETGGAIGRRVSYNSADGSYSVHPIQPLEKAAAACIRPS
jgi:chemotaxis protein CheD